jgi:hypothetical protein
MPAHTALVPTEQRLCLQIRARSLRLHAVDQRHSEVTAAARAAAAAAAAAQ